MPPTHLNPKPRPILALALIAAAALSAIAPVDRFTWALEVAILATVYAAIALARTRGFTPPPRSARLLYIYAFVMLIGAHWTYGQAPPGDWIQSLLHLQRNPWDRIGHLFQGALPALALIELRPRIHRLLPIAAGAATCLFFEAGELLAARFTQGDFIQAQGDPFDSLHDLLFALIGAWLSTALSRRASSE